MKKNILIGLLTVVTVISVTYVFYWKSQADMLRELLIEQRGIAIKNQEDAMRQRAIAEEAIKQNSISAERAKEQAMTIESKSQKKK